MSQGREPPEDSGTWEQLPSDSYDRIAAPTPTQAELTPSKTTLPAAGATDESASAETLVPEKGAAPGPDVQTRLSFAGAPLAPGRILFDQYLVVRWLGAGGMGEVWLVRHRDLDVERALKLIISAVAFNTEHRARFRREARVMAR